MNGVTNEQVAMARQIGILSYLQAHEPQEIVKVGTHEYKTRTHDSLRISDNGMWNWCSHGVGGKNALDYLIRVKGVPFISAVRELCGDSLGYVPFQRESGCKAQPAEKPFALPKRDKDDAAVLRYLRGRGIRDPVLQFCIHQGLLYQSDHNGHKNCIFVGKDEKGTAKYASRRGCFGDYRGDVSGSRKKHGFCIPASAPDAKTVEVYEAPIDALSGASLRVLAGRDWQTVHYLSLGGLNYLALEQFLQEHPQVKTLQLCLDNDEPGRAFAQKLAKKYSEQGYAVRDLTPPKGKDVNEYLQIRLGLISQREPER